MTERDDAMKNTRDAVQTHFEVMLVEGMEVDIQQTPIEELQPNPEYTGGIWALVDIDMDKLDPKPERINVSIPRFALAKIDRFAGARHETRSGFLTRAALNLIAAESKEHERT